jgi:hypothetical protein
MLTIHFQPLAALSIAKAVARYEAADYNLVVGPQGNIPPSMHRLSLDSLTLSFTPDQHVFTGLDTYINLAACERKQLVAPSVDREVTMVCTDPFDEHGIAQGGSDAVHYTYAYDAALLLIRVGKGQAVTRIRCLSCIICGLGSNRELFEIWLEGVNL